jgi:SpoVK/Ycf46/Vps4 family AAA+-type ATPase
MAVSAHLFDLLGRVRARAVELVTGQRPPPGAIAGGEQVDQVAGRLPALAALFELSPLAVDTLLCLVAAELDPYMRTLQRALQREIGRPWLEIGTLADLLGLTTDQVPELGALFAAHGELGRAALAETEDRTDETPLVAQRVKIVARVARHLTGDDHLPEGMELIAQPAAALDDSLVPRAASRAVLERVRAALTTGRALAVEITGGEGAGKKFLVEGLARELGKPVLIARLDAGELDSCPDKLRDARREAMLARALLCLDHWDEQLIPVAAAPGDEGGTQAAPARRVPAVLARLFRDFDGVVFLTAAEREPRLPRLTDGHTLHVEVPFPSPSQRAQMLESALASHGSRFDAEVDPSSLVRRFALAPRALKLAARAAHELATARGTTTVGRADLTEACRHQLRHDLKSLAVRVTTSHKWEDLVIPVDVYEGLKEMIAYLKHAERVYEDWGFGARHSLAQGVSALFAGPPGTGKTMSASVMARELDMELFRVDLSRVVSKWIGETEKNLGKVFDEAQRSNAIILFDEADSLFSKRTDVKSSVDRYANLEVNFLLQRMEAFGGVTILTTNFEDTLDTAFKRRLTFRLRYEKPDAEARAALWGKMFPASAELAPDMDFKVLGQAFEMSGGNIRNAAVRAAFMAANEGRSIDLQTCLLAAEKESREMGLLTRSSAEDQAAPAEAPTEAASGGGPPRLVPVTRPRK